jgi:hypothetical protein
MSAAVLAAETAFLRACQRRGVAPEDVVDAMAAMRGMLRFLTERGAAGVEQGELVIRAGAAQRESGTEPQSQGPQ